MRTQIEQVDRSGAYLARWIAKSIVASKLASRCRVQISYCNGAAQPLSMLIDTYGTSAMSAAELEILVKEHFDLQLGVVAMELGLLKPIYLRTARNGHFTTQSFPWEQPKALSAKLSVAESTHDRKCGT
jgi:S-adenosylmethionine synthetase